MKRPRFLAPPTTAPVAPRLLSLVLALQLALFCLGVIGFLVALNFSLATAPLAPDASTGEIYKVQSRRMTVFVSENRDRLLWLALALVPASLVARLLTVVLWPRRAA